jgi:hypothetical protein
MNKNTKPSKALVKTAVIDSLSLNFYTRPFKYDGHSGWVRDARGNFVFEFEGDFDDNGNYAKGFKELVEQIMFSLNDINISPIEGLKLTLENGIEIYKDDKLFILIRGWGNLTGIGAHNFSGEKASKIQDDFVKWFFHRVCVDCL